MAKMDSVTTAPVMNPVSSSAENVRGAISAFLKPCLPDNGIGGYALGARELDELGVQYLQHRGAYQP